MLTRPPSTIFSVAASSKRAKFTKNPTVDTSFLPDREREAREQFEREELRRMWIKNQEIIKNEDIEITYSYWDGAGHRRVVGVRFPSLVSTRLVVADDLLLRLRFVQAKKGDDIATFLEKCRLQFPELRGTSVDNLMYIKVRLPCPHSSSSFSLSFSLTPDPFFFSSTGGSHHPSRS